MKQQIRLLSGILLCVAALAQQPTGQAGRPTGPRSPEIFPDGKVTLRLAAPNANSVKAVNTSGGYLADWPQGSSVDMVKDAQGVWSVTIGPLKPEYYTYVFNVDGVQALDPRNAFVSRDGIRYSSALRIHGEFSSNYDVNKVPHGTVSHIWCPSPSISLTRRMTVYTPPGYESSGNTRYPVFYLLHGGGNDEDGWTVLGRVPQIMDNLIAQQKAQPMIVVMTNGNALQQASQDFVEAPPMPPAPRTPGDEASGAGALNTAVMLKFPQSLVADVIPFVEKTYRTKSGRENRAIAGLSMGGAQTLYAAFNNIDKFAWVGAFSAGLPLLPGIGVPIPAPANAASLRGPDITRSIDPVKFAELMPQLNSDANSKLRLFYVGMGTLDGLISAHGVFKDVLKSKGVNATIREVPGYGHEWAFWRVTVTEFASRIFTQPADTPIATIPPGIPDGWSDGYVYANGIRIHYYHAVPAPGKPVMVMAHGATDYGLNWTTLTKDLQSTYDIYMVDARGHGYSDPPIAGVTGDTGVEDLVGFLRAMKIEKPILMGHSMGAGSVMRLSAAYPDIPRAAIMLDPGLVRRAAPATPAQPRPGALVMGGSPEQLVQQNNRGYDELVAQCGQESPKWDLLDCQYWAVSKRLFHGSYQSGARMPMGGNTAETLAKITAPALILKADAPPEARKANDEAAKVMKNGKLVHIDGAAHNLHHDQRQRTVQEINAFLKGL